jgi:uncharacterized protein (TIGR02231 family)
MKKIMYSMVFLMVTTWAYAQPNKRIESQITKVTVFLNKAQVTREVKTRIEAGKTNLIFSGLTSQLDPNSIQVSGKGDFILLGISHQQNYLNELETPGRLLALKDSIKYLQGRILFENTQKEILNKEEQMLLSNQKIGGTNQNLPVNELKNMADFFRARLNDIAMSRMRHDENLSRINERLQKLQQQMQSENELRGRNTSEIVVSLATENNTNVELTLDYVVANAGWYALYDLRAINTKAPLSILYKANVFQSTGEVWKNVRLKLSTANPTQGGLKPELDPWYVDFFQPQYYPRNKDRARSAAPVAAEAPASRQDAGVESETVADFVTALQTSLNTEFDIALPYTVNSENKPTTVDIGRHEMKASYKYSVVPKLDQDAFLLAGATGWEDFNLLPGEANVFFEGTFVGKTYVDPQSIKDTLYVSLGRDKRIAVKRNKLKDLSSRTMIGINQKETHGYEITVRNNKSEPILITIEDPIPVSKNSQIEVTLRNAGGGKYNSVTGKLALEITLKPNESRRLAYDFEVKYPKDKLIAGLN